MKIVDSQIHIWENETMNAHHRQVRTYSMDDALKEMAAAGVDAALLHPPSSLPKTNATAIDAARARPDKFAILGHFDLADPAKRGLVETWKQQPGMLGFRFTFTSPAQRGWWDDNTLDWFWAAAEKAGTPVGLLAGGHFATVARVAERHPRLRLLIDHYGRGGGPTGAVTFDDLPDMLALARLPNVGIKVSGAPSYSKLPYPFRDMFDPTKRIFDAFGPGRTFWGTDITRMPCSYRECVTMFTEEMPWLEGADKDAVMGQALCDWVGWTSIG